MSKRQRRAARTRKSATPFDAGWLMIVAACALLMAAPWFLSDFLVGLALTHNLILHFIVTGFVAIELVRSHLKSFDRPREDLCILTTALALIVGAHLLSSLGSVYLRATLLETLRVLDCAAFAWIVARNCRTIHQALAISFAITLSAAIVGRQAAIEQRLAPDPNSRVFVSFQNPNLLAFFLAMALPLWCGALAALRARAHSSARVVGAIVEQTDHASATLRGRMPPALESRTMIAFVVCGFLGVLIAAGLWATGSRGGLGAASVGLMLCVFGLLFAGGSSRTAKLIGLSIVLVGLIGMAGVMVKISQRAKLTPTSSDHSAGFRRYTWKGTLNMIRARPLLGAGAGTYQHVFPRYAIAGFTRHAHQSFLQIAAEQGLIGLASLLVFFAATARACLRGLRGTLTMESKFLLCGLGGSLAAFAAHSLVDSGWYASVITMNVLVVGALIMSIAGRSEEPANATLSSEIGSSRSPAKFVDVVTAAGLIVTTAYAARAMSAEQHYLAAGRLREAGALLSMLEEAKTAALTDASGGEYHLRYGHALRETYRRGDVKLEAVLAEYSAAERLMPAASGPPLMQGLVLKRAREYRLAREALERAVRNEPNSPSALLAVAETLNAVDDRTGARRSLLRIVNLNEGVWGRYPALAQFVDINVARAYARLGDMARDDGDHDAAKLWWRKARQVVERGLAMDGYWSQLRAAGVEVSEAPREEWDALNEELEKEPSSP